MRHSTTFSDYISQDNSRVSQNRQKTQNLQATVLQQKYYNLKKQFQQLEKAKTNDAKKLANIKEHYQIKMQVVLYDRLESAKKFKIANEKIQLLKTQNAYLKSRCQQTQTRIDERKMIFSTRSIEGRGASKENISKSINIIEVKKNPKNSKEKISNQLQLSQKCHKSQCMRVKMDYMDLKQKLDEISFELQKILESLIFFISQKWDLQELKEFKMELDKKFQAYEKKQFHGAAKSLFILCEIQKKLRQPIMKEQKQVSELFKVQQKLQKIKQKSKQLKTIPFLKGTKYSSSQINNLCNDAKNQVAKLKNALFAQKNER